MTARKKVRKQGNGLRPRPAKKRKQNGDKNKGGRTPLYGEPTAPISAAIPKSQRAWIEKFAKREKISLSRAVVAAIEALKKSIA